MKKPDSNIILVAIFFIGLSVLLYPTLSNYYNSFHQSRSIAHYEEVLNSLSDQDYTAIFDAAKKYNEQLSKTGFHFENGEPVDQKYKSLLDMSGDGIMGYISIKKLGVQLPLYHGTSEAVLAAGAGHLEGSSLPVGGIGTHTIVTSHRGLPSAKLFTDLDKMEVGDVFVLTVLNEQFYYAVDKISIVEPSDQSLLGISPGHDYATLITCTPYGINSHRLLVRGVRTNIKEGPRITNDAVQIDPVLVAPVVAAPILLILLILILSGSSRRKETHVIKESIVRKDGE